MTAKTTAVVLASLGMHSLVLFFPPLTCSRFESRDVCEEIIKKFHGQPIGDEGLLLQVRYADTPAQKDLKRITTERRQFRTNEYNVGAYGAPAELLGMATPGPSPLGLRSSSINYNVPTKAGGVWKRETSSRLVTLLSPSESFLTSSALLQPFPSSRIMSATPRLPSPTPVQRGRRSMLSPALCLEAHLLTPSFSVQTTPTISEDGSADDGITVHCDSPAVANGGTSTSPTPRKS